MEGVCAVHTSTNPSSTGHGATVLPAGPVHMVHHFASTSQLLNTNSKISPIRRKSSIAMTRLAEVHVPGSSTRSGCLASHSPGSGSNSPAPTLSPAQASNQQHQHGMGHRSSDTASPFSLRTALGPSPCTSPAPALSIAPFVRILRYLSLFLLSTNP